MALTVLIEGKEAAIKKGSSFEFTSENPMFTESENYTLNISFPLKGCDRNLEIFGAINRHDAVIKAKPFEMSIQSGGNIFDGVGILLSMNEIECKVQFLSGRSSENYYMDLDDIYINNLDLGSSGVTGDSGTISVKEAWAGHEGGKNIVALPFVNMGTGDLLNNTENAGGNQMEVSDGSDQKWKLLDEAVELKQTTMKLAWFPYLIDIAKAVCKAIGYECDFSAWQNSKFYHLLVCQTVPATWGDEWNLLMPHWSVPEFFRNLEPLLEGEFAINQKEKTIRFSFYDTILNASKEIELENVIDEFSADVFDSAENDCKMISERYIGYAPYDYSAGLPYSCPWLIEKYKKMKLDGQDFIISYESAEGLEADAEAWDYKRYNAVNHRGTRHRAECSYIKDRDRYVSCRVIPYHSYLNFVGYVTHVIRVPMMLNSFGPRNYPELKENQGSPETSLQFVPALFDFTELRRAIFVNLGERDVVKNEPIYEGGELMNVPVYDSDSMYSLERGEEDDSQAYFSTIMVGFYPGVSECVRYKNEVLPIIDNFEMLYDWKPWYAKNPEYSLSLKEGAGKFNGIPRVNRYVRFEFRFIAKTIPDVKSVFYIRGNRYLCEKITTTFNEDGMSQMLKGTFWRIL